METLLQFALLAVVVICLLAISWRRSDPHHEFMIQMYGRLLR